MEVPKHPGQDKETVFIIGGGSSLRDFHWSILEPLSTIGCNHAFRLGKKICDVCVFGDNKFFRKFGKDLEQFKGPIVTNNKQLFVVQKQYPWLTCVRQERFGVHHHALGWNGNTGAVAINLAVLQGFTKILLLGFDMSLDIQSRPNYHEYIIDTPGHETYTRFKREGRRVVKDLRDKFPDVSVINLNPNSKWDAFPKMSFETYMEGREHAMAS